MNGGKDYLQMICPPEILPGKYGVSEKNHFSPKLVQDVKILLI